jgi:membrane protein YqaA with SNARE-associated domain
MLNMSDAAHHHKQAGAEKGDWLKKSLIPLLTLLLVIAITVGIFLVYGIHPERLDELKNYAYWGAFLISLIGNAAVILAAPVLPILSAIGVVLYPNTGPLGPIIVGLAGGIAAAIGEMTGYVLGYSGRGIVERVKLYNRLVEWLRRWGALAIFILSIVPFFFDLVGIAAGVLRFPLWKFFVLCWLGRTILYVGIVLVAAWGWETVLPYFS